MRWTLKLTGRTLLDLVLLGLVVLWGLHVINGTFV
jgi:hypothetical protein